MTHSFFTKFLGLVSVFALAMATSACSGVTSPTSGLVGEQNLDETVDLAKLEAELTDVEGQMQQLTSKMDALSILSLGAQVDGGKKLAAEFRTIIDQLLGGVRRIKIEAESLKTRFADRLNQLDPNNPQHIELFGRLEKAIAYLDEVEGYIRQATGRLVSTIDGIIGKVDALVAGVSPGSPLSFIAGLAWQTVKVEIIAVRDALVI